FDLSSGVSVFSSLPWNLTSCQAVPASDSGVWTFAPPTATANRIAVTMLRIFLAIVPDGKVYNKVMRNELIVGDWTAVPSRNLLTRADDQVRIEPRVMDVLV